MYPEYTDPAKQRRDDMILGLIVVNVLLSIILGFMVYTKIINKADDNSKKKDTPSSQSTDATSDNFDHNEASGDQSQIPATNEQQQLVQNQIKSRNVQRKNDASRALAAGEEFISNNVGTLPVAFTDGTLQGTDPNDYPSSVDLQYYTSMEVHFGHQTKVEADTLVLVTGAACNDDGSTSDGSSRGLAVMYGEETNTGTFKGVCITD